MVFSVYVIPTTVTILGAGVFMELICHKVDI